MEGNDVFASMPSILILDFSMHSGAGRVAGVVLPSGVRQFLGVPYAEQLSTREAAFEPPQQLKMLRPEWEAGSKELDKPYGGGPPELSLLFCSGCRCCVACSWCLRTRHEDTDGKGTGLDVLRMHIWAPPQANNLAPVMVWIHGGGDAGSARLDDPNSRSGDRLALSQSVVVCLLEFRQGIFGTMDWGTGSDVPANLELRDMICGLKWIQDNIAAFGGDPQKVTIVGESIGARRVCQLVWCPAAQGLFHRAVASSPSGLHVCNVDERHRAMRRKLVNRYLGLPADAEPSKADLAQIPRMRLVNAQHAAKGSLKFLPGTRWSGASDEDRALLAGCAQVPRTRRELAESGLGFLGWRTVQGLRTGFDASVCDGDLMHEPVGSGPLACEVPLLLVFCKDEYHALGMFPGLKRSDIRTKEDAVQRLVHFLPIRGVLETTASEAIARSYLDAYADQVMPGAALCDVYVSAAQDLWQYHAVISAAEAHSAKLHGRTFVAQYAYNCSNASGGVGCTPHSADVAAIFGYMPNIPAHAKGADFEGITAIVQSSLAAFARTGDPSTDSATFVPYHTESSKMTVLDSPASGGGCKVVDTWANRNKIYRDMLAAISAAET